ncbi:hypothetical protein D3C75_641200 [compost metagenome]
MEQTLALEHLRVVDPAACRHRQVAGVEQHLGENVLADLGLAAVGQLQAVRLGGGAAAAGDQRGGQAHVIEEGIGVLLVERRLSSLPAEAAEAAALAGMVPDLVGAAGDAVAIAIVRIGIGQQRRLGDRLEQTQADHRRRHAQRELGVGVQGAIAELAELQFGLLQFDAGAVLEGDHLAGVADSHLAFRGRAGNRHVLQLAAVDRFGNQPLAFEQGFLARLGGDRQADQAGHRVIGGAAGWMAATVLDVAVLTGVGVEQRAEAVAGDGGGGGDHPGVAEEAVADTEIHTSRRREVGRGQGVGVLIGSVDRGGTAGQLLAGLGGAEAWGLGLLAGGQGETQGQCAEQAQDRRNGHGDGFPRVPKGGCSVTACFDANKKFFHLRRVADGH